MWMLLSSSLRLAGYVSQRLRRQRPQALDQFRFRLVFVTRLRAKRLREPLVVNVIKAGT
jgi:hypothetical protein